MTAGVGINQYLFTHGHDTDMRHDRPFGSNIIVALVTYVSYGMFFLQDN